MCLLQEQHGSGHAKMTLQIPQPQFSSRLSSPVGKPKSLSPMSVTGAEAYQQGSSGHSSPTDGGAALRRSISSGRSKIPRPARGAAGGKGASSIPQHVSMMVPDDATRKGSSPAHSPSIGSSHVVAKAGTPSPPSSSLARTRSV